MNIPAYFILFLAGLLYPLSFPNFTGKILIYIFLPMLTILWGFIFKTEKVSTKILYSCIFYTGAVLTGLPYLKNSLMQFFNISSTTAFVLSISVIFFSSLSTLLAILIEPFFKRIKLISNPNIYIWFMAGLIALIDYYTMHIFPFNSGTSWIYFAKHLKFASFGGEILYDFFTILFCLATAYSIVKKCKLFILQTIACVFVLLHFLPIERESNYDSKANLRLVQANIGNMTKLQSEKNQSEALNSVKQKYLELSTQPSPLGALDLIIWPETAYPLPYTLGPSIFIHQLVKQAKAELLFGGYAINTNREVNSDSLYNSAIFINSDFTSKIYHKNMLLPFAEGLPFGSLNSYVGNWTGLSSTFKAGESSVLFESARTALKFITPICYEILDSNYIRKALNETDDKANAIINLANDSWFNSSDQSDQHQKMASWRSLEFNLPLVRSTNTGITSVFFPDGSQDAQLANNTTGVLDLELKFSTKHSKTIFQNYGLGVLFLTWLIGLIVLIILSQKFDKKPKIN